jgi:hypothetical protein
MSIFGKAKFGGNKRNWWKMKDGENGPYRILPPMGDLADDGRWSVFYNVHYGYRNSKGELRTFQSPLLKNRKTRMVEVPDAALERINQLKTLLDEAKKAGDKVREAKLLEYVGGKKSRYNMDNNHYLNVIDMQGNIGILKIRHRAKLALDSAIKNLRDKGVEPLNPDTGRYFTFSRSGSGPETVYQVSVYKKQLTVAGVGDVEQDVVHQITEDVANRCLVQNKDGSFTYKEAGRLDDLFKRPTAEEVQRIVEEGPSAVDQILDSDSRTVSDSDGGEDDEVVQAPSKAPVETLLTTLVALNEARSAETEAELEGAVSALKAAKAAAVPEVQPTTSLNALFKSSEPVKPPNETKTTAQAVSEQSDEEFLKSLGI